jgi:hypothetical protein
MEEAVIALCERKLGEFLRDFLAKQPNVRAVPMITVRAGLGAASHDQQLLRPTTNGRIGLRAAAQILESTGSDRPDAVRAEPRTLR